MPPVTPRDAQLQRARTPQNVILRAAHFARHAHAGQRRKYQDQPYIYHPARVAGRMALHPEATEALVAAAFLHDVVEDTPHSLDEIEEHFGPEIARLVDELTEASLGMAAPRSVRMQVDREHYARVSREAKLLKLLDRIDNLESIEQAPVNFVHKYCQESRLLAEVIGDADAELKAELLAHVTHLEQLLSPDPKESRS